MPRYAKLEKTPMVSLSGLNIPGYEPKIQEQVFPELPKFEFSPPDPEVEAAYEEYPLISPSPWGAEANFVVVQLPVAATRFAGSSLLKSDEMRDRENWANSIGKIVSIGPLAFAGWNVENPLRVGDIVAFMPMKINKRPYMHPVTGQRIDFNFLMDRELMARVPDLDLLPGITMGAQKFL
jgi:hypothetical protein